VGRVARVRETPEEALIRQAIAASLAEENMVKGMQREAHGATGPHI
jgi:hypothetical protein